MNALDANTHFLKGYETMKNMIHRVIYIGIISILSSMFAVTAYAVSLDDISFAGVSGNRVQITLNFSEPLSAEPLNFAIDNPARIALDLPNVTLNLAEKNQSIGIGAAHSITAVEASGRTRVVLNLVQSVLYEVELQDSSVLLTLFSSPEIAVTPTGVSSTIKDIDFRRGDAGEGKITVRLSDATTGVNLGYEGGQVVVDFIDTQLPGELDRNLDVTDFATPVQYINTSASGNNVRMMISTLTEEYDHLAYQADDLYTIEFKPLTKADLEKQKKERFGYTGERLSLNFQDIEVRAVLQLIADFIGFNLVTSDTVGGNVTLRLKNVPWDQALDIILTARGLGQRQNGNVLLIAPQEELAARERLELEAERQIEELAPLRTEFVQINYADAPEMATLIQAEETNLLSERGTVAIDERTNTLIIQDIATSLEAIRGLVTQLDIPIKQVLIESRIVNVDEDVMKEIGVRFGYSINSKGGDEGGGLSREAGGSPGVLIGGRRPGGTAEQGTAFNVDGNEGLIVDLPVTEAGVANLGLAIGKIGSYLLQLELSALIAEERVENIASPRVITSNQHEALIESGIQIPYQEATSSGATSVSFQNATLSLRVTPQITPDDQVLMDLQVTQNTRGSPEVLGVPPINTRVVSTQVLVSNGETVVLGGVYTKEETKALTRVPFFSEIPYLGFLFKNKSDNVEKAELLIFVTPKILKDGLTT